MMINPSIDKLLNGARDLLENRVLPECNSALATGQTKAVLEIVKRVAAIYDRLGCTLAEENADISQALSKVASAAASMSIDLQSIDLPSRVAKAQAAEGLLGIRQLEAQNKVMRSVLADAVRVLHEFGGDGDAILKGEIRPLFERMLAREERLLPHITA